jgi:FtsH-binding integral membrane protein
MKKVLALLALALALTAGTATVMTVHSQPAMASDCSTIVAALAFALFAGIATVMTVHPQPA